MAALTVQEVSIGTSLTPVYSAVAELGDTFVNNGRCLVHFKNANAGTSRTITIDSLVDCNQGVDHDVTVTVPLSSEEMSGFFNMNRFNNSSGLVSMTYDDHTDLTVAVIKISD